MESHTIDLGRSTLFNIPIDLILKIRLERDFEGRGSVRMTIPLPQNYPLTEVGTSKIVKLKGLFEVELFVIGPNNTNWYLYPMYLIGPHNKRAIVLNKFYNIAKSENIKMSPEESFIFKGLGKKIICIGFPYLIKYFNINSDKIPIMLQASGGAVRNNNDKFQVQQYLVLGRDDIMQIYQTKYPEDFKETYFLFKRYSDLELAEALVSLENNENLIRYYTCTFGFQPITYISTETIMATSVSTFLNHCNK